jgi:hypothetical protein
VTLDGSGSTDADGQIVTYLWSQIDGTSVEITPDPDEPALATFPVPATIDPFTAMTFTLTVTDDDGNSDSADCKIWVVPVDYELPEANSGPPQTVWENETVTLDGSASTTASDGSHSYQWTQLSGSVDVDLADDASLTTFFTAPVISASEEAFVFQLAISDLTEYTSTATVTITVQKNLPPSATSSALTPTNSEGVWESNNLTPTLAANNAADPEGDVLTYAFELYDADIVAPEHLLFGVAEVPEGDNTTTWKTPLLDENTFYYWRSRAYDGLTNGPWMALAPVFVNAQEEVPGVPAVSSPATGTSVATATPVLEVTNTTDPDFDPLTYAFRVYLNATDPIYSPYLEETGVIEGTGGSTQWTVTPALEENHSYWWRVRAADDTGLAGEWTDPVVFLVNSANEAPEPPVVGYPQDGSEIETPAPIFEIEETIDPEGDAVFHYIEIDTVDTFDSIDLIQSEALEATGATTTWAVPVNLDENTAYYFRAKASDGEAESAWTATGSFFLNQFNEPPTTPANLYPADQEVISTLVPTLAATAATDPDQDAMTYTFELFLAGNLTIPIAMADEKSQPSWAVPGTHLKNGKKYFWQVRAVDEHGQPGEGSALTQFTVGANYYQPSVPERVAPFDGGTVNTPTPVLSVVAADDGDGSSIWIEFELYRDRILSDFVSFGMVAREAIRATSWQVDVTLADLTDYFWRARATDGEKHSAWTPVASFTVDAAGQSTAPQIRIWQVANFDPMVPWYTVVAVDDADSGISGTKVILPPGALSTNETIYIGEATAGAPGFSPGVMPLGKVIEFGPSGTQFNVPVTIKIPYTDEDLSKAGGMPPEEMQVYTYNETTQRWESVPVDQVDDQEKVLVCQVDHFSLYSTAADLGAGNGSGATTGGGGSGGCFIGSAEAPAAAGLLGRESIDLFGLFGLFGLIGLIAAVKL